MKKKSVMTIVLAFLLATLSVLMMGLTGFGDSANSVELDETLPVQLSSFTALQTTNGLVELKWTAETETGMLGYNVYRGETNLLNETVTINRIVIAAHNSSVRISYSFTDQDIVAGTTYYYWLQSVDLDLTYEFFGPLSLTAEEEINEEVSTIYATVLKKNYPNPFNPNTIIEYSIKEEAEVSLRIYNLQGRVVKTLIDEVKKEGSYIVNWNGVDDLGREVSSGVYFYRLTTDHYDNVRRMLLIK